MHFTKRMSVTLSALSLLLLSAGTVFAVEYSDAVLHDDPIGYWRFEESSNAQPAADSAPTNGGANDGSYQSSGSNVVTVGQPSATAGLGNAAAFVGGARVQIPDDVAFDLGTGDYTIELWYNTDTASRGDIFTNKGSGGDLGIHSSSQGANSVTLWHGANVATATDVDTNTWHHLAITRSGTSVSLYLNGEVAATGTSSATWNIANDLLIGSNHAGSPSSPAIGFSGLIDEVAIYGDSLTAAEVRTHYQFASRVFDLADALGGGDGSFPGTGGNGDLGATAGSYTTFASNAFVDGTFVPNNTAGAIVIDGAGNTYDFDGQTSAGYYNAWRNGLSLDTDPSGFSGSAAETAGLPDFLGDSDFHSLISGHANKGLTFDLEAVRTETGLTPDLFTAYIGDSRNKGGGSISYFVFLDGVLLANRNNITDDEDFLSIALTGADRYLTLVISDSNNGIGSDHGFIGDPFLRLVPEPSTLVMALGLGLMGLLGLRRRLRR